MQINGKIFCACVLGELILVKCPYYLKKSIDSMQSLSKFQWDFSQKWNNPKICIESQRPRIVKTTLRKKKAWGIILPNFKLYDQVIVIKDSMLLAWKHTHRSVGQNRKPRNNLQFYSQLIYNKEQRTLNEKRTVSSINSAGKTGSHIQKNKTRPLSNTIHKNQPHIDYRLERNTLNCETPRRKHR